MSLELEKELLDVATWYNAHRTSITDVHKKLEFMEKLNDHLVWVLGRVAQDIKNLEHRDKRENNFRGFFLPKGIKFHDGLRVQN